MVQYGLSWIKPLRATGFDDSNIHVDSYSLLVACDAPIQMTVKGHREGSDKWKAMSTQGDKDVWTAEITLDEIEAFAKAVLEKVAILRKLPISMSSHKAEEKVEEKVEEKEEK